MCLPNKEKEYTYKQTLHYSTEDSKQKSLHNTLQKINEIKQKINTFLQQQHNLRNEQENIETTLIMIKMLDEIFIRMVHNQLYYLSIQKIKGT